LNGIQTVWDKQTDEEKQQEKNKFNWRNIFGSSIEIIIASIGFIYALVEKDSKYQALYYLIILLLILGIIFERFPQKFRWLANIILMLATIAIPAIFLFRTENPEKVASTSILTEKDKVLLKQGVTNSANLKKMCAEYLSGKNPINETVFIAEIEKCTDIEEKNLYMACFLKQKENYSGVEEYLNDVKREGFKTDKNYILFLINKSQPERVNSLEINDNGSWLGIDKVKLQEAKTVIDNSYKNTLSILILDASAGFGRQTKLRGEAFKNKLKDFSNTTVSPFDYSQLGKRINLYLQGYYCKSTEKKGMSDVIGVLRRNGIGAFSEPGIYVTKQSENYDIVIVVNK
jgi:hypothetical protein